jgi:7-carboxy-7-deazaguanine synthase
LIKSKNYKIKEMFYTLQGEGNHSGRPAVFCRFTGCNLWNGLESGRAEAVCKFCDTDFVGTDGQNGGVYTAEQAAQKAVDLWPGEAQAQHRYVVFTGGEPALQLDEAMVEAFKKRGFTTAVESNGTLPLPANLDWVCISPKSSAKMVIQKGHELKLVYPQLDALPEQYQDLAFDHFYLQPMDGPDLHQNTQATLQYCLAHPQWKLSLQTHKWLGID